MWQLTFMPFSQKQDFLPVIAKIRFQMFLKPKYLIGNVRSCFCKEEIRFKIIIHISLYVKSAHQIFTIITHDLHILVLDILKILLQHLAIKYDDDDIKNVLETISPTFDKLIFAYIFSPQNTNKNSKYRNATNIPIILVIINCW